MKPKAGADAGAAARKRKGADADARPKTKKSRSEVRETPAPLNLAARPQPPAAFPRGGGTGLSQVEYRQAVLEGRKESASAADDLFQESKGGARRKSDKPTGARTPAAGKAKRTAADSGTSRDVPRIELLNYKRLTPGTRLLCNVLAVHPLALVVSMCDQLVGHVPVTHISQAHTERLQSALDQEDAGEDAEKDEEDSDAEGSGSRAPELRDMYQVGQWVRACVEHVAPAHSKRQWGTGREGGEYERESQRVQLTLEPSVVNEGITPDDLSAGYLLSGAVTSHEDHGYTLDLGLGDTARGFLAHKRMPKDAPSLPLGTVVLVQVHKPGRVVQCTLHDSGAAPTPVEAPPAQAALLPGLCVRALVTGRAPQGAALKLFGMFDASMDQFHLPAPDAALNPGSKVTARVLWAMPPEEEEPAEPSTEEIGPRRLGLSAAPQVLGLRAPLADGGAMLADAFPIGTALHVKVNTVDTNWGLHCSVQGSEVPAFVHISQVSDEHIAALDPGAGAYKVGSSHEARVVGHAAADRLLLLSLRASVLARDFMRVSEVQVGAVVRGTIRRVTEQAIFLKLNGNVDGVVFPLHYSDVRLKHPEKKFKPNLEVKARVIHTDPARNRIVLTLKRSLVQSELPMIASVDDAAVGTVTLATVTRHLDASMLVELGGTLRALVSYTETTETAMSADQTAELYPLGKVVRVRLTRVERETGQIVASVRQATPAALALLDVDAVEQGEQVRARVAAIREGVAVLTLEPAGTRALIALAVLARQRGTDVATLRTQLQVGELLEQLTVVDKNREKGLVILGAQKPAERVSAGGRYRARILERRDAHLVCTAVLLGTACRARLHRTECADSLADAVLPDPGTEHDCIVLDTRRGGREAEISLRPSRLEQTDAVDAPVDGVAQLSPGQQVRGFIKAVTDKGVYVALGRHTDARVMIKELFDEYVKDFRSRLQVGQPVHGTVLSVDVAASQVELSLKPSRLASEPSRPPPARSTELAPGDKVTAYVRGVADYGVFVQVAGTSISGLCHRSELSDSKSADAVRAYEVGDKVKAVVLKVDPAKGRVSFGLKPSYFADDEEYEDAEEGDQEEPDEEEPQDEEEEGEEDEDGEDLDEEDAEDDDGEDLDEDAEDDDGEDLDEDAEDEDGEDLEEDAEDEEDEADEDDVDASIGGAVGMVDDEAEEGDEEDEDEDEDEEDEDEDEEEDNDEEEEEDDEDVDDDVDEEDGDEDVDESAAAAPGLTASDTASDSEQDLVEEDEEPAADVPSSLGAGFRWDAPAPAAEYEASSDEEPSTIQRKGRQPAEDITDDLAAKKLESSTDYERLLLGSPNSSYLWIQFMSFHLELGDVEKARQVARRALQVINYREEQEKLNVWIALLNLENTYGSQDTLDAVFREAVQMNDAKTVYLRLLAILEKSDKIDQAADLFRRAAKKFGYSAKIWVQWYQFYLRHGRAEDAHALVPRSMQALERRKHIKALCAYALSEYKLGDPERARTLFETLVDRYPKRLDLWWQYIDQEAHLHNTPGVRALLDRVLTTRKNTTKQVKSLLQKWLVLEKRIGDEAGIQAVLERARAFVEEVQRAGQAAKQAEGDEEAEMDEME